MKVEFKRRKKPEGFSKVTISFKEMTQGAALALCHALNEYARKSAVCEDLEIALNHAVQRENKTREDQELFEVISLTPMETMAFSALWDTISEIQDHEGRIHVSEEKSAFESDSESPV
jgi:hypothetical protein